MRWPTWTAALALVVANTAHAQCVAGESACCADRVRALSEPAGADLDAARELAECGDVGRILYDAAIEHEAARLIGRAIRLRQVLLRSLPEHELAPRTMYLVAANYHALAMYAEAAEAYEGFARRFPGADGTSCTDEQRLSGTCPIAHEALQNAIFFRLGIGDEEAALEDARLFERYYARSRPRETAQLVFSLGAIYERTNEFRRVFDHYRAWLRQYGRHGLPHDVIRANLRMGRARWELGDRPGARPYFEEAARAWTRRAGELIANLTEVRDEDRALYLARAKEATGEALFYLALYEEMAFTAVRFPVLRGQPSLERVEQWAEGPFSSWLSEKRAAMMRAEVAYERIAELEVPEWTIAAALRVGEMYLAFAGELGRAPIPRALDEALASMYRQALSEAARPLWAIARERFESCATTATRVRVFSARSLTCMDRLAELSARESTPATAPSPRRAIEELLFSLRTGDAPALPAAVREEAPVDEAADPRRSLDPLEGLDVASLSRHRAR